MHICLCKGKRGQGWRGGIITKFETAILTYEEKYDENLSLTYKSAVYMMEYSAAERKEELLPFSTAWMELENNMFSEISQAMKDHTISPITGT